MDVEVVALIYKSTAYMDFLAESMERWAPEFPFRFVANDATQEVKEALGESELMWSEYIDPIPDAFYMKRVYRAWNFGVRSSQHEHVLLINSDMALAEGALQVLIEQQRKDPGSIYTSRLVESGKMPSGPHAISLNFGRTPAEFDDPAWQSFARATRCENSEEGGLYMPVIWERDKFIGYPEGNVGRVSGDVYLFQKDGRPHRTVFESLVYHVQEGEKDE